MKIKIVQVLGRTGYSDGYEDENIASLIPLSDWEEVEDSIYPGLVQWVNQYREYRILIMSKEPISEYCKKATEFMEKLRKKQEADQLKYKKAQEKRNKESAEKKKARELKKLAELQKKYANKEEKETSKEKA